MKKYLKLLLKISISLSLIFFIFRKIKIQDVLANVKLIDPIYIPLIISLIILNYVVSSYRWKKLLVFDNTDHVTVDYLIKLYFVGSFFNNFLPTSIGGDVYKIFRLSKKIGSVEQAFSATFLERFSGVVVLAFIALFSLHSIGWTFPIVIMWFLLGLYIGWVLFVKLATSLEFISTSNSKIIRVFTPVSKFTERVYNSILSYKGKYNLFIYVFITSLIVQALSIATQFLIFYALGYKLSLNLTILAFPIITLASFLIPSLNGIGVQDFLYTQFFMFNFVPKEISLAASFLYHTFRLAVSLIGGVIYAFSKND